MWRWTVAQVLFVILGGLPVYAQEMPQPAPPGAPYVEADPAQDPGPVSLPPTERVADPASASLPPTERVADSAPASLPPTESVKNPAAASAPPTESAEKAPEVVPWQTVWGIVALRGMPTGARIAPNGDEYHPNFSLDLDFNCWLWRDERLYLFADGRLWGETGEYGVTNGRDGWMGTSKREFDLSGGAAWNYAGRWEARAFGYTNNNLNRGTNNLTPEGFTDGFGLENRFYLAPEYAHLGETGFDVARATFLSFGYYPSKVMVGNNGQSFEPGMFLHAYLTYDLWDWPVYVYGDFQYISERELQPRLFLFDVGLAVRPFRACRQCEFRVGCESTADVEVRDDFSIGYVAVRYIF